MLYCQVCSKVIEGEEDATYHGNGLYKHSKCYSYVLCNPLYHRRKIYLDLPPFCDEDRLSAKYTAIFEEFGAKSLYHNSEYVILIYPDDFPERLIKYYGDIISTDFWGITGIRQNLKFSLPDNYIPKRFPDFVFKNNSRRIFRPKRLPRIKTWCWY
jgi:hypothetical protein